VDANGRAFWRRWGESAEETALVRVEDDREEDIEKLAVVLFREEVEAVREWTGACVDGCEVEGSLILGAGLVAASARFFSRVLIFRVRESTWKLSFLRSLSTLAMGNRQTKCEKRKHHYLHQVFVIGPLNFGTFLLQILLHLVVSFLHFLELRFQTRFLAESVELAVQRGQRFLMLGIFERELQFNARGLLL